MFYNQFCTCNLFIHNFIIFASNDTLSLASQLNFHRLETCKREIMWRSHWALCLPQLLLYQLPFMGVIILFTIIAFQSVIIYLTCLIPIRLVSREIITEMQKKTENVLPSSIVLWNPVVIWLVNDKLYILSTNRKQTSLIK